MISVHRTLPDCRSDMCRKRIKQFNGSLPEFSVVLVFNNEAWTTLLRSVHSLINRTPQHLLKEILLVDDNSDFDHLRGPLHRHFRLFPKVKIIHSPQRIGLIRARLLGFDSTVAPVVIFLDSHVECFPGWAESMLIRITRNPQAVVFPIIESISDRNFGVQCTARIEEYCTFLWKTLQYHWVPIPRRELNRRMDDDDSYRSPVMPGGIFAVTREFFTKLGKYDPKLGFWGGENMELSFKTWMCGGTLEMDPCSYVGHVFRLGGSIKVDASVIFRNAVRVAEVWMDDYKNYFYEMNNYRNINPGNVTDRVLLRQSLQCKSFAWYLKNLFPEQTFPHSMNYAGEIRSRAFAKCIDSNIQNHEASIRPILIGCSGFGRNQVWYMGVSGHIFQEDLHVHFICVTGVSVLHSAKECQPPGPHWEYRKDNSLYHVPTGKCLTADGVTDNLSMTPCTNSSLQKWHFQERRTDLGFPRYT
ncbi:unnamed protein product [Candidula unifasciata]|uniref:Polypeptide N-acetylgalactosaminyltransferase n=1 Tax=Candidula unifasciata TaxID=100452 RepID=A0A8S3YYE8_9EUPU|nr:unnamed protein product [Candidula unifasciata]